MANSQVSIDQVQIIKDMWNIENRAHAFHPTREEIVFESCDEQHRNISVFRKYNNIWVMVQKPVVIKQDKYQKSQCVQQFEFVDNGNFILITYNKGLHKADISSVYVIDARDEHEYSIISSSQTTSAPLQCACYHNGKLYYNSGNMISIINPCGGEQHQVIEYPRKLILDEFGEEIVSGINVDKDEVFVQIAIIIDYNLDDIRPFEKWVFDIDSLKFKRNEPICSDEEVQLPDVQQDLEFIKIRNDFLEQQKEIQDKEMELLQKKYDILQTDYKGLQEDVETLQAEFLNKEMSLKKQKEEFEAEVFDNYKNYQLSIDDLKKQREILIEEFSQLEGKYDSLNSKYDELQDHLEYQQAEMQDQYQIQEDYIDQLKKDNRKLRERIDRISNLVEE